MDTRERVRELRELLEKISAEPDELLGALEEDKREELVGKLQALSHQASGVRGEEYLISVVDEAVVVASVYRGRLAVQRLPETVLEVSRREPNLRENAQWVRELCGTAVGEPEAGARSSGRTRGRREALNRAAGGGAERCSASCPALVAHTQEALESFRVAARRGELRI